jgi:hypothetical protein
VSLGHPMRWSRGVLEAILVIALIVTGFLLYVERTRVRSPFLPRYVFKHDERAGTLLVQGTWTLEGEEIASPNQTTTIWCDQATKRCSEVTAVLLGNDRLTPTYTSLLPATMNELDVVRWDSDLIVARGQTALCVDTTVNIHFLTEAVTGYATPREGCAGLAVQAKRMRMIDGHKASVAAHGLTR